MALPANINYGTVSGVFLRAKADGADVDRSPDGEGIRGLKVTFTPSISPALVKDLSATPPVTILIDPVSCTTDDNGVLCGPDGQPGVQLVASGDTDLDPSGWTWTVEIKQSSTFPRVSFSFVVGVDSVIDLSTVVPVPAGLGADLILWAQAVADTLANSVAAQTSADAAAASATTVANSLAAERTITNNDRTAAIAASVASERIVQNATIDDKVSTQHAADVVTFAGRPVAAENVIFVTPRGDDSNDGLTLKSAKLTLAAAAAALGTASGRIQMGVGTFALPVGITLRSGASLTGAGTSLSVINYTGDGAAITTATPGVRSYQWQLSDFSLNGPGIAVVGTSGIDYDSVSQGSTRDIIVKSFERGIRVRSIINGGATYNRFNNVTTQLCTIGISVEAAGSNATVFHGCRASSCTVGLSIIDANNTAFIAGQLESNTTGASINATSNALSDNTLFAFTRFETNTTAWEVLSANVRTFMMLYPIAVGTYTTTDLGTRGTVLDANYPSKAFSTAAVATGSWRFERTVGGGTETPLVVFADSNTATGTAVAVQAETGRTTGFYFRGRRAGVTYFDVTAAGQVRASGGLGVGNTVAATTLGAVVKKMEIFDAAGASLGFIPIYSTIT